MKNNNCFLIDDSKNNNQLRLQDRAWKYFKLQDIFSVVPTKGSTIDDLIEGNDIAYIAAKKNNNGFTMMCTKEGNEHYISKGNCIVFIQLGEGSAGYTLYQEKDFIGMKGKTSCGYNYNLNKYNALFIVTILDKERPKFSFGRSWTGDRLFKTQIQLPATLNGEPDWQFMEDYIKNFKLDIKEPSKLPYHTSNITLQDRAWKYFKLQDIFTIHRGNIKNISEITETGNNGIPVITASENNNGISTYITDTKIKTYQNSITIANNGSIGSAFYQAGIFTATSDISILSNQNLSLYNSLFITSIIIKEKYRFNYGRKWGLDRMRESAIKLPVNKNGEPDWQFMEDYIKSLPYSKNLDG